MVRTEERVSYLEGKIDSLATKEDVGNLRAEMGNLRAEQKELETRLIKWTVGTVLTGMVLASSLTLVVQNLVGG